MPDAPGVPAVLAAAGLSPGDVAAHEPLTGGTYNGVHRVLLTDGTRLVLKIPPGPGTPAMTYERGLLTGEAVFFHETAAHAAAPVPRVVTAGEGFLLMTECPGTPWSAAGESLTPGSRAALRRELGATVARLHRITGPRFGYPGGAVKAADDWRGTFTAMLDAALADAERYGADLPVSPAAIRATAAAASPALDAVTVPALVHFDLWEGNVLLHEGRIGALIDGERMFWGDPLADFASLTLLSPPEPDADLLAGYAAAGGDVDLDAPARTRMAFYRAYLYLIMLVEGIPRASPPAHLEWARREVTPHLLAALDVLAA
ncbi:phosphotransferase family protein [Streptomyces avicenniae]|uniref:phosphotransferase family protein n=1 Tax=Streptomyces avicenniae TaxID=500153 RepID=UPI00069A9A1D|nr:aminoglycoside phosphotransferase family protein [Streptomyces avicenniae]